MKKLRAVRRWLAPLCFFSCLTSCGDDGPTASGVDGGLDALGSTATDTRSTSPATLPDPCSLLTAAEWAPLMEGTPVVEPRSGSAGGIGVTRCDWTYNENGAATGIRRQWGNIAVAVAGAYGPSPMSQPIDIGDSGYFVTIDIARTIDIGWKKGTASATFKYSVLVVPPGKVWLDLREAAIALARQAAARMP